MHVLDTHIDQENVEYKLFSNEAGKFTIRVFDLDANEVAQLVQYPTREAAEAKYRELIARINPKDSPALLGREITLSMPNGESRRAQFAVVELDDVLASHDEETFAGSPGYPTNRKGENINDRNYADDPSAQARVQEYAQNLDPYRIITTSRTPSGTPIVAGRQVAGKWIVVSGNNRTMSTKLAARKHPANYEKYVRILCEEWPAFGFRETQTGAGPRGACNTKNQVVFLPTGDDWIINKDQYSFQKPLLVRIDYDFPAFETQELAKYNQSTMKGKRQVDKTIERSNILAENELCRTNIPLLLDPFETMSDFYRDRNAQKEMLGMLIQCNIITEQSRPEYYEDGFFTEAGKDLIESVLAGVVLDKQALKAGQRDGVKNVRKAIVYALPALMSNQGLQVEARLIEEVNEAVLYQNDLVSSGLPFDQYINQGALFTEKQYDPQAIYLNRLMNKGQRAFKTGILSYNQSLNNTGSAALFADQVVTPAEAFEAYVKKAIPENEAKLIEQFGAAPKAPNEPISEAWVRTERAEMVGQVGDRFLIDDEVIKVPKPGFLIADVSLKKGVEKGKGYGKEIYEKALREYGVLYSAWPVSDEASRVHDSLVRSGIARRGAAIPNGQGAGLIFLELASTPSVRLRLTKAKLKIKLALLKL